VFEFAERQSIRQMDEYENLMCEKNSPDSYCRRMLYLELRRQPMNKSTKKLVNTLN